ncbi:hypothetical protein [Limosilactobacillus mucosae]|jgi:hypothetical protein|uniref:hypothetical protein n=1 Tax=Limosilactobacillus mucosae TaxID=97478 RepID=UPI000FFBD584|nr:hypothetical protein [Limosilactobacillus mucosae]RXA55800.1 hypothetical protein EQ839_08110 [Limosilactobacillus mucosae]
MSKVFLNKSVYSGSVSSCAIVAILDFHPIEIRERFCRRVDFHKSYYYAAAIIEFQVAVLASFLFRYPHLKIKTILMIRQHEDC